MAADIFWGMLILIIVIGAGIAALVVSAGLLDDHPKGGDKWNR